MVSQENVVVQQSVGARSFYTPIEHQGRRGEFFLAQPGGAAIIGQQICVDVRQIRIGYHEVGVNNVSVCQRDAGRLLPFQVDLLYRAVIIKTNAQSFRNADQAGDHLVHAAAREPDALGELSILKQREGRGRVVRAHTQIHILKREYRLEPGVLEITRRIRLVFDQRFQP